MILKFTSVKSVGRKLRAGAGAGGKFNGLLIKTIIKNINDLEEILPEEAGDFIKYLESLRDLHKMCIEEELPSNFK